MTRNEAIEICKRVAERTSSQEETFVGILGAFGLLKIEEPKTATERALDALTELFIGSFSEEITSEAFCKALKEAGVRIVDK